MIVIIFLLCCLALWPGGPGANALPSAPPETPPSAAEPASAAPQMAAPLEVRFPYFPCPENLTLCGEAVPLKEQSIREALDREFVIVVWSRAQTTMWLKRAHRYFPEVEQKLKAKGMPLDLKYVVLVESDLRLDARSHSFVEDRHEGCDGGLDVGAFDDATLDSEFDRCCGSVEA